MSRPAILEAKVDRLAEIIIDTEEEREVRSDLDSLRKDHISAVREIQRSGGSVSSVRSVPLPSERRKERESGSTR